MPKKAKPNAFCNYMLEMKPIVESRLGRKVNNEELPQHVASEWGVSFCHMCPLGIYIMRLTMLIFNITIMEILAFSLAYLVVVLV